jgi:hypothetical protein
MEKMFLLTDHMRDLEEQDSWSNNQQIQATK